jgi:transcriptional regulator with XRE-family HTH domain
LVDVTAARAYAPRVAILPAQIRAARAWLGWTRKDLSARTGLSVMAIKQIESEKSDPRASTLNRIEKAFYDAGVVLLDDGDVRPGGAGIRLIGRER